MLRSLALASLLLALAAGRAHANDGDLVWKTIESAHFVVHYPEPYDDLGRRVTASAERAFGILVPVLGHTPSEKTQIVLTDDTEGANGFATAAPRNRIQLFATAPRGQSVLADHDDWLFGLVLHELTHVIHLDTVGGIPRWYNKIWGKVWMPNQIQPRWFIEGLATYQESKRTAGGRTRNTVFDMYLRMSVLARDELRLDQVSSGPALWPHGNIPYLYGSHFLKFVADEHGDDVFAQISASYGKNPIPWDLGKVFREATGENLDQLWEDWRASLRRKYGLELRAIERRGVVEGRALTDSKQQNQGPRFTPDGTGIAWTRSDGYSDAQYRVMPVRTDATKSKQLAIVLGGGGFAYLPDGELVIERTQAWRTNYDFSDLWRVDPASGEETRLTWGARAMDVDVSLDGRWAAFAQNGHSHTVLAIAPVEPHAEPIVIYEGEPYDQVMSPAWSTDGKHLAFVAWQAGGRRDLYMVDVATHEATRLTDDRALDGDPVWSPDGTRIYFTSDRDGVNNVYAIELATRRVRQVTNVRGGAFQPDVSPDGKLMVYVGYRHLGFELYELPIDESTWLEPATYVDDRPDPVVTRIEDVAMTEARPDRAIETLAPRTWEAKLILDSWGDAVSVSTNGGDMAGYHGYGLGATVGLTRGDLGVGGSYGYGRRWASVGVSAARSIGVSTGLLVDGRATRYTEESWGGSATLSFPVVRRALIGSDLAFSYDVSRNRMVEGVIPEDPNMAVPIPPELGTVAGGAMRWNYSLLRRYAFSIGPQLGRQLFMGVRFNHPGVGSDFRSLEVSWRWQEYIQTARRQTLSLRYAGGIETTNRRRDGAYGLGGTPSQDVVSAILDSTRLSGTAILRGYPPGFVRGRQFHLLNAEYRFALKDIERGFTTLPAYLRRIYGVALLDAGDAFSDQFEVGELKVAVGAAVRAESIFGFYEGGSLDLGIARGLTDGGETQYWILLTSLL